MHTVPRVQVSTELLTRYDQPGPRYTSYPTAVEFHDGIGAGDYLRHLEAAAARPGEPLAFYTHLPFCEKRCLFCGCHAVVSPHHDRVSDPYLTRLKRETELVAGVLGGRRKVRQYHWGGGTPTYLSVPQMDELVGHFKSLFEFEDGAEIAVEADPRVTTVAQLEALRKHGFNRLSLGVQDFDARVQELVGRVQPRKETERLIHAGQRLGFEGINIDLIYGLPGQRTVSFRETAKLVVELGADRVAIYSFAFVPWLKGQQKKLPEEELPRGMEKFELLRTAEEVLLDAGYVAIGMDHFAKPGDELALALENGRLHRNFMGYTTSKADDLIGLGISAIGSVGGGFFKNEPKLSRYYQALDAGVLPIEKGYVLTDDDRLRGEVIMSLMCRFGVDLSRVARDFGISVEEYFGEALRDLEPMQADGLVERQNGTISVTPLGRFFVRNIAMVFDRYLPQNRAKPTPVFSRTV